MAAKGSFDIYTIAVELQAELGCGSCVPLGKSAILIEELILQLPNGNEVCLKDLDIRLSCASRDSLSLVRVNKPCGGDAPQSYVLNMPELMKVATDMVVRAIAKIRRRSVGSSDPGKH